MTRIVETTTRADGTVKVRAPEPQPVRPFYFDREAPPTPFGRDTRITSGVVYATSEAAARAQFNEVAGKVIPNLDRRYRFLDLATVTDRPHGNIAVITVRDAW